MYATISNIWLLIITSLLSIDKLEKIDDTPFSDISEDIADIMEVLTEYLIPEGGALLLQIFD